VSHTANATATVLSVVSPAKPSYYVHSSAEVHPSTEVGSGSVALHPPVTEALVEIGDAAVLVRPQGG